MADRDSDGEDQINGDLDVIWCIPGIVAGLTLAASYVQYLKSSGNDETWFSIFVLPALLGPAIALMAVAGVFRKEVQLGRMSWEEYWIVLSGISAAACVFLGVTGIDDVVAAWDYLFRSE